MDWKLLVALILGIGGIITSIILTGISVGNRDSSNELGKLITFIIIPNLIGAAFLTIATLLYLMRNRANSDLFLIVGFGLSIFLSLTAVSITTLERAYY